jgi:hypothetical protein
MAGRFFLSPQSLATFAESTILKIPLSRSVQWMQPWTDVMIFFNWRF